MTKGETAQGIYAYQRDIGPERGDAIMRRYLCQYCHTDNPDKRSGRVVFAYTQRQAALFFNHKNRKADGTRRYTLLRVIPLSTTPCASYM